MPSQCFGSGERSSGNGALSPRRRASKQTLVISESKTLINSKQSVAEIERKKVGKNFLGVVISDTKLEGWV